MLSNLIIFVIIDAIIINCGILFSFYIKFLGNIPDYNLGGYEGLYLALTFSYFISIFFCGLYGKSENHSYYKIVIKSVKAVIIATMLSMMFAYFLRNGRANAFPFSVFIVSLPVNIFFIAALRIIQRLYNRNIQLFNCIIAFILNRIPEAILITTGIYAAYILKFRTLHLPEYNFQAFIPAAFIISFSYFIFIYKFLLFKYSREQSNFSVLWVMIKTSVGGFITAGAALYIFREQIMGFPSSVLTIAFIINYFLLSIWHIIIRRGYISEIEVDLEADCDCDEETDVSNAEETIPEKDGLITFFRNIYNPSKAADSFKNYGDDFFTSSLILYFVTFWMILVYICFMPDYLRLIFQKAPFRFTTDNFNYLNNLRVFAVYSFAVYLFWLILKTIIYKIQKAKNIKNIWAADCYLYGLNIIFFLLVIIIGNFSSKYIMFTVFILLQTWIILLNIYAEKKIFEISTAKSILTNLIAGLITTALIYLTLIYFYKL